LFDTFNNDKRKSSILQTISRCPLIRIILGAVNIALLAAAICMELLAEEEAKVFVIPTLVAALVAGIGMLSISKIH
jgi:stage V sporulation protein SpoVS